MVNLSLLPLHATRSMSGPAIARVRNFIFSPRFLLQTQPLAALLRRFVLRRRRGFDVGLLLRLGLGLLPCRLLGGLLGAGLRLRRLLLGSLDGVGGLALHLRELRVQRGDLLLEPCGLLLGGGLGGLGGGEVGLRPGEVRLAHGEVRGGLLAATSQQRGEDGGDGEFHGSPTKSRVFDCTGLSTTTGQKRNAPGAPIFKPPWATRRRAPTRADKRGGSRPACALV